MNDLIQIKESTRYPGLFVKKYKKKVFYDNLWNESPELLEARGHVVDSEGKLVIRPFTKIFNYQENGTTIDRDELCVAVDKINGFMAAATYIPSLDEVVVSTTGSLDSDFVDMAKEMIGKKALWAIKELSRGIYPHTYMFEIVHPNDPHIIEEKEGAYLIGMRYVDDDQPYFSDYMNEWSLDVVADAIGARRPHKVFNVRFSELVESTKDYNREGFVIYGQLSKVVLKIKTPYYLVMKLMARKKDILTLSKQKVDEEFYPLIDYVQANAEKFSAMDEQSRLNFMKEYLCVR